jgi:hypothetical protein
MDAPEKIVTGCLSDKQNMEEVNDVISAIDRILNFIKSKSYEEHMKHGDLAKLAWNLSVAMFNLGEMVAEYTTYANASYIYRKFKYADLLSTKYDECNRMVMVLQSVMKQAKEEYLRSDSIRR